MGELLLNSLPSPTAIHQELGALYRRERLLRKLLRIAQAVNEERSRAPGGHCPPDANAA